GSRADYDALLQQLRHDGRVPQRVVHGWTVGGAEDEPLEHTLERGFYSLLALTQALGDVVRESCRIDVVSSGMQEVIGSERWCPAKAAVLGPCRTIPYEYPHLSARSIDIELAVSPRRLLEELLTGGDEVVALRGTHRWLPVFERVELPPADAAPLRERGVYLITGGLGGIALSIAEHLANTPQARLVLVARTPLPARTNWAGVPARAAGPENPR